MKASTDAIDPVAINGIGTSPLRKEDWPLLRGEGTFIADFKRPRMAHALVVRSPFAHARLSHIAGPPALPAPGPLDLITPAPLPDPPPPTPTPMPHHAPPNHSPPP